MIRPEEKIYQLPPYSTISAQERDLLGQVISSYGFEELTERLITIPSLRLDKAYNQQTLTDLLQRVDAAIEQVGYRLVSQYGNEVKKIPFPFREWFHNLQGGVNELICSHYVKSCLPEDETLITNLEIIEISRSCYFNPDINISFNRDGIAVFKKHTTNYFGLPDGLVFKRNGSETFLKTIYDFRSTLTPDQFLDLQRRAYLIEQTIFIDETAQDILQTVMEISLNLTDADKATAPNLGSIPLKLVVGNSLIDQHKPKPEQTGFNEIEYANIDSIRRVSLFMLQVLTGKIPRYENWQDYFPPTNVRRF